MRFSSVSLAAVALGLAGRVAAVNGTFGLSAEYKSGNTTVQDYHFQRDDSELEWFVAFEEKPIAQCTESQKCPAYFQDVGAPERSTAKSFNATVWSGGNCYYMDFGGGFDGGVGHGCGLPCHLS